MTYFDRILDNEIALIEQRPKKSREERKMEGFQFSDLCGQCGALFSGPANPEAVADPDLCIRCLAANFPPF